MYRIVSIRNTFLILILIGAGIAVTTPRASAQEYTIPSDPVAPTRMEQCKELDRMYGLLIKQTESKFKQCYNNRKREAWGGVVGRGRCANWGPKACYGIVDTCDSVQSAQDAAVTRCREKVLAHIKSKQATDDESENADKLREKLAFDAYEGVTKSYDQLRRVRRYIENPQDAVSKDLNRYVGRSLMAELRGAPAPQFADQLAQQQYDWVSRLAKTFGNSVHRSPITKAIFNSSLSELNQHHRDLLSKLYELGAAIDDFGVETGQRSIIDSLPAQFRKLDDRGSNVDRDDLAARLDEVFGIAEGSDVENSADPYEVCADYSGLDFSVCVDEVVRGNR